MLPVCQIASEIVDRLKQTRRLVLSAPTGSGKTTQVPQIVHRSGLLQADQQLVILQPRRLATRMVAARVASEMHVKLGGLVGYQTRHDSAACAETRILFMTEGLMLRMLQRDSTLRGIGMVILDEFHERSLSADLSLALLKSVTAARRPDLKLMAMSATIDADRVAAYLRCETLISGSRLHPVQVRYLPKPPNPRTDPPWTLAARALPIALEETKGDVLIFMPGAYEIARTIEACEAAVGHARMPVRFHPLHGSLSPREQDAAVEPWNGGRKVVVATNVAETSITIEGITAVIDSGLARVHRYDARRGLNALRIEPISKASADQRAGRAGRIAPGLCLRLWTSRDHGQREEHDSPEIERVELAEAILMLRSMGVHDLEEDRFDWFTPPPPESMQRAEKLLRTLDAVDDSGSITSLGRTLAEFPAHPRLSRIMADAGSRGCLERAIIWAALINERPIFTQLQRRQLLRHIERDEPRSDLAVIERAFRELQAAGFSARACSELNASSGVCRDVERTARQFERTCRRLNIYKEGSNTTSDLIASLLVAYRDHLAVKIEDQRAHCAMPGRKNVLIDRESVVEAAGPIIAVEMTELGRGDTSQTVLSMVSEVNPATLQEIDPEGFETREELQWNASALAVEKVELRTYHGLTLSQTVRPPSTPDELSQAAQMIGERIVSGELKLTHWNDKVEQWIVRTRCMAKWMPESELISYDADDLRVLLHEIVGSATRFSQVREATCMDVVRGALDWNQQQLVERMAPESIALPGGWRMKIEYVEEGPPKGRAKIQDLYDLEDTPRIAGGRVPILLEILGPNFRPVQVTSDLKGFWRTLYPELKKELKRRYPRHEWR